MALPHGTGSVVLDDVVVVLVVVVTQDPCESGFTILKSVAPPSVTRPPAKLTLYESPPAIASRTHPVVPGFGGTTDTAPSSPLIAILT
jgi:hypothetical protein